MAESSGLGTDSWRRGLGREEFDVAFSDPPYAKGLAAEVAREWMECPFARVLGKRLRCRRIASEVQTVGERRFSFTTARTSTITARVKE